MIEWVLPQAALKRVGCYAGLIDGVPGPKTSAALLAHGADRPADAAITAIGSAAAKWLLGDAIALTPQHLAKFVAQTCNETGGYTRFEEDMHYSAQGLANTWLGRYALDPKAKKKAPNALARRLAPNPQAIANDAYAGRMGNTAPGEGWAYRGRGLLQLTGRAQYATYGLLVGVDLIAKPELATDPTISLVIAREFWRRSTGATT